VAAVAVSGGGATRPASALPAPSLDVLLHVDGRWTSGTGDATLPIIDPATEETIGRVAKASQADLERAVEAADRGFATWRNVAPFERARALRRAGDILRERVKDIAAVLTAEQGKPIPQAIAEVSGSAESIDWFAEEGKRCFGQVIPGRTPGAHVITRMEPVGPVVAFTPWNFPVSQAVKKLAAALAAGCSVILKGSEETPAACAELVRAFVDAGLPPGVLQLLYGDPVEISNFLIPHPVIRKVTFTGSVPVGKLLAGLAGSHMKRVTMELGGHAPVIVCDDADIEVAATTLAHFKYVNAGQVCLSATRFLIAQSVYDAFVGRFAQIAQSLKVGDGRYDGTTMGPLASARRVCVMEELVADAVARGARLVCGGRRIHRPGYFFEPTVLANVPVTARAMNEEPFGPIALLNHFDNLADAIDEANRLPYGLASFVYTCSLRTEAAVTERLEAGMVAVNRVFQSTVEAPFGGIKDSGIGSEGGTRAILNYLNEKMVTRFVG
jgi:succinate-semialdehyde dehydrogenase / glutarate-semialdehyde dehydrogenase